MKSFADVDLGAAREIVEQQQVAKFAALAEQLGVALALQTLHDYVAPIANYMAGGTDFASGTCAVVLEVIYRALRSPDNFAMDQYISAWTVLAVRQDMELVVGVQRAQRSKPFPKTGWRMGKWFKDPAKNHATVAAWAGDPARQTDALRIPIAKLPTTISDSRGDALLAAVCADPEDAAARLVYADWLVEHGDLRGELIRVQCELASKTFPPAQHVALEKRSAELEDGYKDSIVADLEPFVDRARIRRGLVEEITIFVPKLVKHGPQIVANHPITELRILVSSAEDCKRIGEQPFVGRIPTLAFESRKTPRIIHSRAVVKPAQLATSSIFATTKRLEFSDFADAAPAWTKFFQQLVAPQVERLDLVRLAISPQVVTTLANANVLPALRELRLAFPLLGREGAAKAPIPKVFAQLAERPKLAAFAFDSWHIGDATLAKAIAALLASKSLVRLRLNNCTMGSATAAAIAKHGGRLEQLVISGNRSFALPEVTALVAGNTLKRLAYLSMSDVGGDPAEIEAMVQALEQAPARLAAVYWTSPYHASKPTQAQQARVRATRQASLH